MSGVKIRGKKTKAWKRWERISRPSVSSLVNPTRELRQLSPRVAVRRRGNSDESRLLRLNAESLSLSLVYYKFALEDAYTREGNCNFIDRRITASSDDTLFRRGITFRWNEIETEIWFHGDFNDFVMWIDWTSAKNKRDNYQRRWITRGKRG